MYILKKTAGGDAEILAVSRNAGTLRDILRKDAAKTIRNYYADSSDSMAAYRKRQLLDSLAALGDASHWDDGEESYLLEYDIVRAPLVRKPKRRRPMTCVMAFGTEAVRAFENCDTASDVRSAIASFGDTDALVVRTFGTPAEKRAYEQGMADIDGWNRSCELSYEYPQWRRHFKNIKNTHK